MKEFETLSNCMIKNGTQIPTIYVKKFIKKIKKISDGACMYADMDADDFWATSKISPLEAEKRAKYYEEFLQEILELAGDKLADSITKKSGRNKMSEEYILKFVEPQITIQKEAKEDFKKIMNWTEEQFMEKVFVRLKGTDSTTNKSENKNE